MSKIVILLICLGIITLGSAIAANPCYEACEETLTNKIQICLDTYPRPLSCVKKAMDENKVCRHKCYDSAN